jgi:hypothetical protein
MTDLSFLHLSRTILDYHAYAYVFIAFIHCCILIRFNKPIYKSNSSRHPTIFFNLGKI